jgi:DNA helicase-2/ATP-dependent DNA helicase PcrA
VEREDEVAVDPDWELVRGARVLHEKFGRGTVQSVDPGADPIVTVVFSGFGDKRIKARFLRPG